MYQVPIVQSVARPRLRHWWWASFLGGAVAGALSFAIGWQSQNAHLTIDSGWILGATLVGFGQSLVLRPVLGHRAPWILSCLMGAGLWVAFTITISWLFQHDRPLTMTSAHLVLNSILSMLVMGSCQALVLRRVFRQTGWWLGGAVGGGLLGTAASLALAGSKSVQMASIAEGVFVWGATFGFTWACMALPLGLVLVYRLGPRAH